MSKAVRKPLRHCKGSFNTVNFSFSLGKLLAHNFLKSWWNLTHLRPTHPVTLSQCATLLQTRRLLEPLLSFSNICLRDLFWCQLDIRSLPATALLIDHVLRGVAEVCFFAFFYLISLKQKARKVLLVQSKCGPSQGWAINLARGHFGKAAFGAGPYLLIWSQNK